MIKTCSIGSFLGFFFRIRFMWKKASTIVIDSMILCIITERLDGNTNLNAIHSSIIRLVDGHRIYKIKKKNILKFTQN